MKLRYDSQMIEVEPFHPDRAPWPKNVVAVDVQRVPGHRLVETHYYVVAPHTEQKIAVQPGDWVRVDDPDAPCVIPAWEVAMEYERQSETSRDPSPAASDAAVR
jgi:hypothetical protein